MKKTLLSACVILILCPVTAWHASSQMQSGVATLPAPGLTEKSIAIARDPSDHFGIQVDAFSASMRLKSLSPVNLASERASLNQLLAESFQWKNIVESTVAPNPIFQEDLGEKREEWKYVKDMLPYLNLDNFVEINDGRIVNKESSLDSFFDYDEIIRKNRDKLAKYDAFLGLNTVTDSHWPEDEFWRRYVTPPTIYMADELDYSSLMDGISGADSKLPLAAALDPKKLNLIDFGIISSPDDIRVLPNYRFDPEVRVISIPGDKENPKEEPQGHDKGCPNCATVDPVVAGGVLTTKEEFSTIAAQAEVKSTLLLFGPQITNCSNSVKNMRQAGIVDAGSDKGFWQNCIPYSVYSGGDIREIGKTDTMSCLKLFASYDKNCFTAPDSPIEGNVIANVGILVRSAPNGRQFIHCTAWRADREIIITSAHCLMREDFFSDPVVTIESGTVLRFIPFAVADLLTGVSDDNQGFPIVGEYSRDGSVHPIKWRASRPSTADDLSILALDVNRSEAQWIDRFSRSSIVIGDDLDPLSQLMLIGFQEIVRRAYVVDAVLNGDSLPSDDILIQTGEWRRFIRVDKGPVCRGVPDGVGGIEHYCQSFARTSGAPLFALQKDVNEEYRLQLVGVQSSGIDGADVVWPNNKAALVSKESANVLWRIFGN